jgi:TPR repeat protein
MRQIVGVEQGFWLADRYYSGFFYPNSVEAAKWARMAAEQGQQKAQLLIAMMYYKGEGFPQNYAEAATQFQPLADSGNLTAQFYLGEMHAEGRGVPENIVTAHMWFNLAAAQGHSQVRERRDSLATIITREQISEAQRLALEWKVKSE